MALQAGTKLGPYEIVAPIGAGGMGEVYKARDTRLDRTVAIKILPQSFAHDPDRLRRFEIEARTVAGLNHPNILELYDIGQLEGAPYIVCELLEGETLREKMSGGAVAQRRAVEYASQIADGLAAAHDREIVHRDLKPENVFVTKDGHVKLLDFGLAKLARAHHATATQEGGETETAFAQTRTTPGLVLGTAGYMSPEQVRGQEVDERTDIFAFGAILYEMLSGVRAFRGDTSVETMNAILKEEPPELDTTQLHVAPGLERIVRRCLEKEPGRRFQSARDVGFALEALSHTTASAAIKAVTPAPWRLRAVGAIAIIAVIAVITLLALRNSGSAARVEYFAIPVQNEVSHMAISNDGTLLAFASTDNTSGQRMLFVQAIGSKTATPLPGTENALFPFWSPDNQYVAFFANGKLMKAAVSGGAPLPLATVTTPRGGSWSKDNVIIFSSDAGGPILRVNADGTGLGPVTEKMMTKDESSHRWPQFLPDGKHFIFWAGNFSKVGKENGIWISALDSPTRKFVQATYSNAQYLDPGKLVYVGEKGQVLMQDFDAKIGATHGEARVIGEGLAYDSSLYWAAFTVSQNGILVSNTSAAASLSQLTWVDRKGKEQGTVGPVGLIFNPAISPDGTRVSEDVDDVSAANVDVWIRDLVRGTATRFTFAPDEEADAIWSPDGADLAFRKTSALVLKPSSGLTRERVWTPLAHASDDKLPNSWTPDGSAVVYTGWDKIGNERLMIINRSETEGKPLFPGATFRQACGMLSADGKWLAYGSDESGRWEVYVTNYPGLGGKWQVSQGGGTEPRWRRDGRELFYLDAKGTLTAVAVSTENGFSSGVPQALFPLRARMPLSSTDVFSYDVTRDGQKFLVNRYVSPAHVAPLDIALNIAATEDKK